MKLTWFGARTLRIHIGGKILVANSEAKLPGIERVELESGADEVFGFPYAAAEAIDLAAWKPRRRGSLLDEAGEPEVKIRYADGTALIDAVGEPPLVLMAGTAPRLGRWAQDAVVVIFGEEAALLVAGKALLADSAPRLLMLAGEPKAVGATFEGLRGGLEGTGLVALEKGMAVEV